MSTSNNYFVKLSDNNSDDDINKENLELTNQKIELQECLFCFEPVDLEKSFIGCDTCGKQCHDKCYFDWFKRKNNGVCISCQQPTLVYSKIETTFFSKCLYNIFGKKQKVNRKFYDIK